MSNIPVPPPPPGTPPPPPGWPGSTPPSYPPPQAPPPAYPPPQGPYYQPAPEPPRKGRGGLIALISVLAVMVLVASAVAVVAIVRDDSSTASAPKEGEVFLEAAAATGPDVFTTVARTTPPSINSAATTTPTTARAGTTGAVSGGQPGLYGGTGQTGTCDAGAIASYLADNPAKARAWVDALNADSTVAWSGGTTVTTSQISAYLSELTPVVLTRDTRVTNHGFKNGRATPRQAVLQAGTAVLVDRYGTPRVKCGCGNPLTKPAEQTTSVTYTGDRWQGFDPAVIVVVQPTTVIIQTFVIVNVDTGTLVERPPGTDGTADVASTTTTVPATTTTLTPAGGDAATFCSAMIAYNEGANVDTVEQAIAAFSDLAAKAPAAIAPDMAVLLSALRDVAAGTDRTGDANVLASVANVEQWVLANCGYDLNG
jgi:hypothetical protein